MPAGFESKAGFKREATVYSKVWPSASPAVIDELLPFISESVDVRLDQQSVVTKDSRATVQAPKTISSRVDGGIAVNAQYSGLEFFLVAAMGLEARRVNGTLLPEDLDSSLAFRHLFEIDPRLDAIGWTAGAGFIAGDPPTGDGLIAGQRKVRRGTFAVVKGDQIWEALSCMVTNFTMQVSPSGVTYQASVVGHSISYDAELTQTDIETSVCDPSTRILFQDCRLYLRVKDGNAIDPETDDVGDINGFALSISNNLTAISTRDTGVFIDEPRRRGAVVVSGSFGLPRHQSTSLLENNREGDKLVGLLEFVGEQIPGTSEFYTMRVWLPDVTLTGAQAETSGPGQVQQNFSFLAAAGSPNAGFPETAFPGPMFVELINTVEDHPLLD